jgi:hypothetical protein
MCTMVHHGKPYGIAMVLYGNTMVLITVVLTWYTVVLGQLGWLDVGLVVCSVPVDRYFTLTAAIMPNY